jgi:hypothetical protein
MSIADALILDGILMIAVLLYYRNRPKPNWLKKEIRIVKFVAKVLRIIKCVPARVSSGNRR